MSSRSRWKYRTKNNDLNKYVMVQLREVESLRRSVAELMEIARTPASRDNFERSVRIKCIDIQRQVELWK